MTGRVTRVAAVTLGWRCARRPVPEADWIVRADVIVHRFRQKKKLVAFEPGNVRHARFLVWRLQFVNPPGRVFARPARILNGAQAGASPFQGCGVCARLVVAPAARVGGGFHRERSGSGACNDALRSSAARITSLIGEYSASWAQREAFSHASASIWRKSSGCPATRNNCLR